MKFLQKIQLGHHMDAIHLKKKNFICTICGKSMINMQSPSYHFHIFYTGKSYSRAATLSSHMLVHKKKKNCTFCDFKTFTKILLDKHIEEVHTGVIPKTKDFVCEICGRPTKFLQHLLVLNHFFNRQGLLTPLEPKQPHGSAQCRQVLHIVSI
jgi:hypothetical protein